MMGRKSVGCLIVAGTWTAVIGFVILVVSILGIVWTEKEMDHNRELYAESRQELDAYYEDTLRVARYNEFSEQWDRANEAGDSALCAELFDSLDVYGPPPSYGHIGFNIAGAFFLIPAIVGVAVLCIGLLLLLIGFIMRWRENRQRINCD